MSIDIDYQTGPDLGEDRPLTTKDLFFFQMYRQSSDLERVEARWEDMLDEHLRLCELAILRSASGVRYWADLPLHPILDVNIVVFDRLRKSGFRIEADKNDDRGSRWLASWLHTSIAEQDDSKAEVRRRDTVQNEWLKNNPPIALTKWSGGELADSTAIWASVIRDRILCEVQKVFNRPLLCLFNEKGECIHWEPTSFSFGAVFGPDEQDVSTWTDRCAEIVSNME